MPDKEPLTWASALEQEGPERRMNDLLAGLTTPYRIAEAEEQSSAAGRSGLMASELSSSTPKTGNT